MCLHSFGNMEHTDNQTLCEIIHCGIKLWNLWICTISVFITTSLVKLNYKESPSRANLIKVCILDLLFQDFWRNKMPYILKLQMSISNKHNRCCGAVTSLYVKDLAAIFSDLWRWYERGRVRHTSSPKAVLRTSAQLALVYLPVLLTIKQLCWSKLQHTSCCSLTRTICLKLDQPRWHIDIINLSADFSSRRSARVGDF